MAGIDDNHFICELNLKGLSLLFSDEDWDWLMDHPGFIEMSHKILDDAAIQKALSMANELLSSR